MTKIITNPDGTMQTADDDKPTATEESVREYRRKLREQLNGGGWHPDGLGPNPTPSPAPADTKYREEVEL